MSFHDVFGDGKPLIGVIHLPPLPGSPRYSGDPGAAERRALSDARVYAGEGYDGLIVENYGDAPFLPGAVGPETVAAMTRVTLRVAETVSVPVGVNVLRSDALAALAVALAAGGRFLRVNVHTGTMFTDQGMIEGRAHETLRARARLGADTLILADVLVKHAAPPAPASPARAARDAAERGLADALLVTGDATGAPVDPELLLAVREAVPGTPVLVASGVTPESAGDLALRADGAVVGTATKRGGVPGAPVDRRRARRLRRAWPG